MKKILHDTLLNIALFFVRISNSLNAENFKFVGISQDDDGGESLIFGYSFDPHKKNCKILYSKKLTDGFKRYILENVK